MSQLVNSISGFQLTNLVSSNKGLSKQFQLLQIYKLSKTSKTLPKVLKQTGLHQNVNNQLYVGEFAIISL